MRLNDLTATESPGGAGRIRFETLVADITGSEDHRLVIDGPVEVVRSALAESEINIRIDPNGTRRDWYERYEPVRQQELDRLTRLATLDRPQNLYTSPPPPDLAMSVLISLHRIRGHGSVYVLGFPILLPAGRSFSMWLPFVCTCMGVAFPAAVPAGGDISLSLALNFSSTPVATSATPGSATEVVTFSVPCWPWRNFIPFFTVTAVTASLAVCEIAGATFFP
jgi:hypothetical protein